MKKLLILLLLLPLGLNVFCDPGGFEFEGEWLLKAYFEFETGDEQIESHVYDPYEIDDFTAMVTFISEDEVIWEEFEEEIYLSCTFDDPDYSDNPSFLLYDDEGNELLFEYSFIDDDMLLILIKTPDEPGYMQVGLLVREADGY